MTAAQPIPDEELIHLIALTMIPSVGDVNARELLTQIGSAKSIFQTRLSSLEKISGIGKLRARRIKGFNSFQRVEQEIKFIRKFGIQVIPITDEYFPKKLSHCYDAPVLLYYRGNANLNASRVISIIGTRSHTEYGKDTVRCLLEQLSQYDVLVVSGLAYGIDAIAHKNAMKCGLKTIGVLAHGLDRIYPPAHRSLAKEMIENGGLLTEFMTGDEPGKQNFPKRNRIVAGMADATIVVETGVKGGSMITAELANGYNKDVFAFPGRIRDAKSEGCNFLIKKNKAALITEAKDLIECMNWEEKKSDPKIQRSLFVNLSEQEEKILQILSDKESVQIEEIYAACNMKGSEVASAVLNLELQGLIQVMPGKRYRKI